MSDKQVCNGDPGAAQMLKQLSVAVDERDAAEEAMAQAYYIVTGRSPEWSNQFGYEQALLEIAAAVRLLKSAVRDERL